MESSIPIDESELISSAVLAEARGTRVRLDLSPLAAREIPSLSPTLFGNTVAVPPAPVINMPLPPPPKPSAPPLPYTYLGQYRDADGKLLIYLGRGSEVILASPGTKLDELYKLEADLSYGLTITYLPLKEAQIIPIGNTTQ
ncbi:MAG: hypothetical protein FDZ72_13465 [Betaproteobacteria bacterium]|nr:MAG: hypothetical protein FDZ72_13465 [Betaproteobacteria bacterium]